jgi:putative flavoprotein involved in K+ transport
VHATLDGLFRFGQLAGWSVQKAHPGMGETNRHTDCDIVVIGAGQAGLAVSYYLRRTPWSWIVLDGEVGPGPAWRHGWDSLRLFSPAQWSSLPGWPMPARAEGTPTRDDVVVYFAGYEARYALPIQRSVRVQAVRRGDGALLIETDRGVSQARAIVSATGTWGKPYIPSYPGQELFRGIQIHSADYRTPQPFAAQRVLIIGGGNSGAQILAEVSQVAETTWVTLEPPHFLPDHVDGRVLFEQATARFTALQEGRSVEPAGGLGDIVMVPPVCAARDRGVLHSVRPFLAFTPSGVIWTDGRATDVDAVIWCTGFRPVLDHLAPLGIVEEDGHIAVNGTRAIHELRLWLVGYGEWTGFASATIIGVGRTARTTVSEIDTALQSDTMTDPRATS